MQPPFPPGPKGRLLLGNLVEFRRDILGFFAQMPREYGDIVGIRLGLLPACIVNHPSLIEQVLVTQHRNFRKHRFFWRHVTEIFGRGLVTNEGSDWLRQRRLAQPAFHRDRIAGYGDVMVDYAQRMTSRWTSGTVIDMHAEMMRVTMEIVTKTLFGAELSDEDMQDVSRAFGDAIEAIAVRFRRPVKIPDFIPLPANVRYRRGVKRLNRLVYRLIDMRRNAPGDDLLSMLMAARDEDGSAMDERQLRDEAITIFLAGHETTALALSWTFDLLARHPETEQKLLDEIDAVLGGRAARAADVSQLPFARAVVEESMRLYPPAYAIGREAADEFEIGGYVLPKGTVVYMSPWAMHRDERFYPEPERFRPERWLNGAAKDLPRFAYLPFGGGPRICIGNSFAMMEAVLILVTVLQRFRAGLVDRKPLQPFATITLRPPLEGVRMRVTERG